MDWHSQAFFGEPARYDEVVHTQEDAMARRTLNLPDSVEALVRESAADGESFSAAASRLIEAGAAAKGRLRRPRYVGSGAGPHDLGRLAESYLRDLIIER